MQKTIHPPGDFSYCLYKHKVNPDALCLFVFRCGLILNRGKTFLLVLINDIKNKSYMNDATYHKG